MKSRILATLLCGSCLCIAASAVADEQLTFQPPTNLSVEGNVVFGGAIPGGAAKDGRLVRLESGRLLSAYLDAASSHEVWTLRGGVHKACDVFVRYSDDEGLSWSNPVNVSRSANVYSALTDWSGDGIETPFYGDSEDLGLVEFGNVITATWIDRYLPPSTWSFGDNGSSPYQGRAPYQDPSAGSMSRWVPFGGVYVAVSMDGGTTWQVGGSANPPLQLTYGRRDAALPRATGWQSKWMLSWQEDPLGLRPGIEDAMDDAGTGAKASLGTDIWYTFTSDIGSSPVDLRVNRLPLTNHSHYDLTSGNGFPMVGPAGSVQDHAASMAVLRSVQTLDALMAVVAYEETKGHPLVFPKKDIHYDTFQFDTPPHDGIPSNHFGTEGVVINDRSEHCRTVGMRAQPPSAPGPALSVLWKQGVGGPNSPGDLMVKLSPTLLPVDVVAAGPLNMSSNTPTATGANLFDSTSANPYEDVVPHRTIIRNNFIAIDYCYSPNGPLARYTDLENYNYYIRRSLDGGQTWLAPQKLSNLPNTSTSVYRPRIIMSAMDSNMLVSSWTTMTNVYEGLEEPTFLDVEVLRSVDQGSTFDKIVNVAASAHDEQALRYAINDDATRVFSLFLEMNFTDEVNFSVGRAISVPDSVGTLFCFGNSLGGNCPCGNHSDLNSGQGCANSSGFGSVLYGTGSTAVSADNLMLIAEDIAPFTPTALVFSGEALNGGFGVPFGDGLRCFAGPSVRLGVMPTNAVGTVSFGPGLAAIGGYMPGDSLVFQLWYRDPFAGSCGAFFNLSNALEVIATP